MIHRHTHKLPWIAAALLLAACAHRSSGVLVLQGGEEVRGTLQSYQGEVYTLRTEKGEQKTYPAAAVKEYRTGATAAKPAAAPPAPAAAAGGLRPEFATPQATMETYRQAAARGDFETMAACCSNDRRASCLEDLKNLPPKQLLENLDKAKVTQFIYEPPLLQGNRAFLKFTRKENKREQQEILPFVLESDGWKIETD